MSTGHSTDIDGVMAASAATRDEAPDEGSARDWKRAAAMLWALLDDIDTADDVAKGDDAAFRRIAQKVQQRRFQVVGGDEWDRARTETDAPTTPCESIILDGARTKQARPGDAK